MDFTVIDAGLVAKLRLLLLVGMGPKIALVPFLEMAKSFAPTKAKIGRQMVLTATVTASDDSFELTGRGGEWIRLPAPRPQAFVSHIFSSVERRRKKSFRPLEWRPTWTMTGIYTVHWKARTSFKRFPIAY